MWETNMTLPKQRNSFPWGPEIDNSGEHVLVSTKIYIYSSFEEKKTLKTLFFQIMLPLGRAMKFTVSCLFTSKMLNSLGKSLEKKM